MYHSEPLEALSRFYRKRVLVVGDVMLDRYLWGTVSRISPEAPVPIVARQNTTFSPGGAANVAVSVAALGGDPILIGVTGDDASSRDLLTALSDRSVDSTYLLSAAQRRTTVKTRVIAHNQQLLRIDEEETTAIDRIVTHDLLERIDMILPSVGAVVLSDYAKGVLTPHVIAQILLRTKGAKLPVLVDPKGRDYTRYQGASLLTPNRTEALQAAGLPRESLLSVVEIGQILINSLAVDALLITEGEGGMTLFESRNSAIHVPATARVVYDVTGAGDAVIATLGLALGSGSDLRTATYLANLTGGLSVEHVGTAAITADMIAAVLQAKHTAVPVFSESIAEECVA